MDVVVFIFHYIKTWWSVFEEFESVTTEEKQTALRRYKMDDTHSVFTTNTLIL